MTMKHLRTAVSLLFFALSGALGIPEISCKNGKGQPVDWFTFYKLPRRHGEEDTDTGLECMYLDSTTTMWRKGWHPIDSNRSALGTTLEQLYEAYASKSNATAYLLYNDGVPKSVTYSKKYGHTKVPEDGYSYPSSGRRNAQNGICITFKYDQFEEIDSQLLVSQPNIYSCFIPTTFHWELIYMPKLCAKSSSSLIPRRRLTILQSMHGHDFLHFAKSGSYSDDIFTAWMAQQLKTHLLVQTWQRKRHELPSNCSLPYHVYNVKIIQTASKYYFSSHLDHSKWCVSTKDSKNHWTCIGDLNRSPTQASRSGGFICTRNPYLYQSFYKLVFGYEFCN